MRTFKCFDCGHTWQLPFGQGGMGSGLSCPECKSRNVHRAPEDRGWRRWSGVQPEAKIVGEDFFGGRGTGRGGRAGRGRRRRGNWNG
jgi:DNA-directed RNA polymerase subunit RPC12/RpoP